MTEPFSLPGFRRDRLHDYYLTEADGQTVAVFPIDKALRYLIPFRPPAEIEDYLRRIVETGGRLAIAADDGEKFGGWPGTSKWVYEDGWLKGFLDTPRGGSRLDPLADRRRGIGWSSPRWALLSAHQFVWRDGGVGPRP